MKRSTTSILSTSFLFMWLSAATPSVAALPFALDIAKERPAAQAAVKDRPSTPVADRNRKASEAPKQPAQASRQRQADAARQRQADDARRQQAEAARQRQADAARQRQADDARRQQAEAARQRQADAARQRQADDARRRQTDAVRRQQQTDDARRRQQADDARRRQATDAGRRQDLTDAQLRRAEAARRQQMIDEARRRPTSERPGTSSAGTRDPRVPAAVPERVGGATRPALSDRPGTGQAWMEAPRRSPRIEMQPGSPRVPPSGGSAGGAPAIGSNWSDHAAAGLGTSLSGRKVRPLLPPPPPAPLPGDPPSPSGPPIVVPPAPMVGGPTIVQINQPVYNFNSWTCAPAPIICPDVIILPRRHSFLWTYRSSFVSRAWWHDPWCDPFYGWAWSGSHWRTRFGFSVSGSSWAFGFGVHDPFWRPFRTHAFGDPWCRPITWRPVRFHRVSYIPFRSHRSLWLCDDWYGVRSWYAPSTFAVTHWDRGSIATLVPPMPAPLAYITADGWDRLRDGDIVAAHDIFQSIYLRDSWDLEAGFGLVVTSWFWNEEDAAVRLLEEILLTDVSIVDRIPTDPQIQYQFRRLSDELQPRAIADVDEYGPQLTIAALEAAMMETLRAYYFADQALRSGADRGAAFALKDHVGLSLRR